MPTWPRRSAVGAVLTTLIAAFAAFAVAITTAPAAQAVDYTVSGIDVAGYQHPGYDNARKPGWVPDYDSIDWAQVAASGQQFAIVKASESTTFVNPYYASDVAKARAAGLVVGAYHYARPGSSNAVTQAQHFARVIGNQRLSHTLPPVLDIEDDGGKTKAKLATWTQNFLDELQRLTGRTPMIYSYQSFLKDEIGRLSTFARYPLWIARYSSVEPTVSGAWSTWNIWQYTSSAKVPGIEGNVDVNWFNGTRDQLLALADGGSCNGLTPAAPTGLTASRTYLDVDLQWTPPADAGGDRVEYYTVSIDGVPDGHAPMTRYIAMSLTPGTHTFSVAAVNCTGTGPAVETSFTVDPPDPGEVQPPPAATTLALGTPSKVNAGTVLGVDATLRRADTGQTLRNRALQLSVAPKAGKAPGPVILGSDVAGTSVRPVRFVSNATLSAAFAGDARLLTSNASKSLKVKPVVRISASKKKVRARSKLVLTARVDKAYKKDRVAYQLWRKGKWRTQDRKRFGKAGKAVFTTFPSRTGKARYRMWIYKTVDHTPGNSATKIVRVKKRR
jgi:lysozyme